MYTHGFTCDYTKKIVLSVIFLNYNHCSKQFFKIFLNNFSEILSEATTYKSIFWNKPPLIPLINCSKQFFKIFLNNFSEILSAATT